MENVIGILKEVIGHTYDTIYDLYFTEERLIAVLIQHPSEVFDYKTSTSWQNILLGNSFSKRKEQNERNRLADERRSKNKAMTPSELAATHPANFLIRYESIANLEINTGLMGAKLKISLSDPKGKNLSFSLTKKQAQEVLPILESVLPSKIKRNK